MRGTAPPNRSVPSPQFFLAWSNAVWICRRAPLQEWLSASRCARERCSLQHRTHNRCHRGAASAYRRGVRDVVISVEACGNIAQPHSRIIDRVMRHISVNTAKINRRHRRQRNVIRLHVRSRRSDRHTDTAVQDVIRLHVRRTKKQLQFRLRRFRWRRCSSPASTRRPPPARDQDRCP